MPPIIPKLLAVETKPRHKDKRFHFQDFRRALALAWPYRRTLAAGLVSTVIFATLHTVSIGAAFPVFKLLLEDEGLQGWVDRMAAGERCGVEFAPGSSGNAVVVLSVDSDPSGRASGIRPGDLLTDTLNRPSPEWLAAAATAEPGETLTFLAQRSGKSVAIEIQAIELPRTTRALRWLATRVGAHTTTDEGKLQTLTYILMGLICVVFVANVFRYFGEVLISKGVLYSMLDLRSSLYEHVLHLPMSFFAAQPTADLVTRFVQDIQEIQRGLLTFFGKFIREPLRAMLILVLALTLDWRITLTMVVVVPFTVAMFWYIGKRVKKANRRLLQLYGHMIDALTTSLQNLRVVKVYTAESMERQKLRRVDLGMFKQQLKLAKLQAFISPAIETLAITAGSFLTVWLAGRVIDQELSTAKFGALGVALSMLFDPLRKLTDVYVRIQRSTAGAERIFHLLDSAKESDLVPSDTTLKPLANAIVYDDVVFTYPGATTPALCNVSLTIKAGETLAIVGPNGCGKTTLVSMLPRFFDPDSGSVRYDGVDLREAELRSLRKQIGLVSQDTVIFAGTPTENISYGADEVREEQVLSAASNAYADDFISKLDGGFEAVLGERGTTLSGGQRQRMAIARAVYRDAPILIFDEATSQVDSESELKIQTAIKEFSKGRTTLIIAHRLSTIQFASRIVVMDKGRIIDQGTHEKLSDRCKLYRNICDTQLSANT